MKCPLSQGYFQYDEDDKGYCLQDCLNEECAWWYEGDQCCAITNIARDSTLLLLELIAIKGKMPHEEQFRK